MGLLGVTHRMSSELDAFLEHILARGDTTVVFATNTRLVRAFRPNSGGMEERRWFSRLLLRLWRHVSINGGYEAYTECNNAPPPPALMWSLHRQFAQSNLRGVSPGYGARV
jgi:hypothetical protein